MAAADSNIVTLSGTFTSAPVLLSATAANAGGAVGVNNGDTITLVFDQATEYASSATLTKAQIDALVSVSGSSSSLGTNYAGEWSSSSVLVITITNAGGAVLVPGTTQVSILVGGDLEDVTESSGAVASGPRVLGGTFTEAPTIVSISAANDGGNVGAGPRDTIRIVFDQSTNGGNAVNKLDVSEAELSNLLQLSVGSSLGTAYRGVWSSSDLQQG